MESARRAGRRKGTTPSAGQKLRPEADSPGPGKWASRSLSFLSFLCSAFGKELLWTGAVCLGEGCANCGMRCMRMKQHGKTRHVACRFEAEARESCARDLAALKDCATAGAVFLRPRVLLAPCATSQNLQPLVESIGWYTVGMKGVYTRILVNCSYQRSKPGLPREWNRLQTLRRRSRGRQRLADLPISGA